MRKKILGTDLKVSAIGLGCMGMNHAYGASVDKTEMINLIAQAVDIVCPVTAIQNRYSMMARWHEKLFPVLEELNIGFVAFSPLANGFLSGKYNAQSVFEKNTDYRSIMPQFPKDSYEKNQEFLAWIQAFAEEKNATVAQISLAWLVDKKPYLVPIPGTRKLERLKENAGASDILLTPEEFKEKLDKIAELAVGDACTGSNPRAIDPATMAKLFTCTYYGTEVDF